MFQSPEKEGSGSTPEKETTESQSIGEQVLTPTTWTEVPWFPEGVEI